MNRKRKGVILPTVMLAFLITMMLFTVGLHNIPINKKIILEVKEEYDYKSILSNFHQLSLAKITDLTSQDQTGSTLFNGTDPIDGFSTYYNDFFDHLEKSLFSEQWKDIKKHVSTLSAHELILKYKAGESNSDDFVSIFANYIESLPERASIDSCESVIMELDNSNTKIWIVNKLQLNNGDQYFSSALINRLHHYNDDYFYFTETEGNIWFTDSDVINGPLASMDTIHINGSPEFNGTVFYNPEVGTNGFELDGEHSAGIFNGDPPTSPLPTDTSFATISAEYKEQFQKDFVSFSDFFGVDSLVLEQNNLSASSGNFVYYAISVPSTCTKLTVKTFGGYGNADLYIRKNQNPNCNNNLRKSTGSNNNEVIILNNPSAGNYYIGLYRCHGGGNSGYYSNVTLQVLLKSTDSQSLFNFDDYETYTQTIPESNQINFNDTQALVLDYQSSSYNVDIEGNEIKIDWVDNNNVLQITFDEVQGHEDKYEATYQFSNGNQTYSITKAPFSGFISTGNERIYLGDYDNGNGGDLCYYKGKLTFQSTNKIFIEDSIIPTELKNCSGLNLNPRGYWDATQTNTVKEQFESGNVTASLNLVTDDNIYIGSKNYNGYTSWGERPKDNQKIFASLFSFNETISVADHDAYQLGDNKDQLTIFGSLMQRTRGAVGTFGEITKEIFYNNSYYRYRIEGNAIQAAQERRWHGGILFGYYVYSNWKTIYTLSEETPDAYKIAFGWDNRSVRVFTTNTETITGYNKNYYFDPRFNNGYIQGAGVPQTNGITVLLSGNIEVY